MSAATSVEFASAAGLCERPVWLGGEQPIFAVYHPSPAARRRPTAVLFCAPFGWEEMSSYPIRRAWAQSLATAGYPVLRFDLPGTGQSAGGPDDPGLVGRWLTGIETAAAWLRKTSDASVVAAIGIGMGALLALEASASDSTNLDELVLWDLPRSGRELTRRMRMMGLVTQAKLDAQASGEKPDPRSGWLECGGYTLSAETVADLGALTTVRPPSSRIRQVLLLEADKDAPSEAVIALATRMRGAGVAAEVALGPGYADMLDSPHLSLKPDLTIARVREWLDRDRGEAPTPGSQVSVDVVEVPDGDGAGDGVEVAGGAVRERAFVVERPSWTLFGVLAEPTDDAAVVSDTCIVCLPALAERCIGPNRLWVELARRHAARGVTVLRVDLSSVGDSSGSPELARDQYAFTFDPDRVSQVTEVLDALQEQVGRHTFVLAGLCSAGFVAQEVAAVDDRVVGVLSLNPVLSPSDRARLESGQLVLWRTWLRRLLKGDLDIRNGSAGLARFLLDRARGVIRSRLGRAAPGDDVTPQYSTYETVLDSLARRDGLLVVATARQELVGRFFDVTGLAADRERWPALRVHRFESSDHDLRPLVDQRDVHVLADGLIGEILDGRPHSA